MLDIFIAATVAAGVLGGLSFVFGVLPMGFILLSLILVFIIFLQKGKSSLGLGSIGGANTLLFGGSGGQDIFQKATWILLACFMFGSLYLAIKTTRDAVRTVQTEHQSPIARR